MNLIGLMARYKKRFLEWQILNDVTPSGAHQLGARMTT